jgi:DNA-binding transcriptional MocR family regulator
MALLYGNTMARNGAADSDKQNAAPIEKVRFVSHDRRPLYQQLAEGIGDQIRNGRIARGQRLPALRDLARVQSVAVVTASAAYDLLSAEGLIESRTGRGTYVCYDPELERQAAVASVPAAERAIESSQWDAGLVRYGAPPRRAETMALLRASYRPGTIALSNGHTAPETYPLADFARCFARTFLDDPPEIHQYRADRGDRELREILAHRLRGRGAEVTADDILVVSGAQQALSLVAESCLNEGDIVAAEAPSYFSALEVFDQRRISWVNLAGDADGVLPESVDAAVRRCSPRLLYVNSAAQNPTGSFLARARHRSIVDAARQSTMTIVEDQTGWPLAYDGDAPPPLFAGDREGRVILIESISKLLFPSLRIGYIAARGPAMEALYAAKLRADTFTTTVSQRALARFFQSKAAQRHVRNARVFYRRRRDALVRALGGVLPEGGRAIAPRGGVNIWVELPRDWSAVELFGFAAQEGVLFLPGTPFYPSMPATNTFRLSFGTLPAAQAPVAAARLGRAFAAYAAARKRAPQRQAVAASAAV